MSKRLAVPTRGAQGGVVGRPRKEPPADAATRIRELAATGHTLLGVAAELGVGVKTLREWLSEREDLHEAFGHGRDKERFTLHNVLYTIATDAKAEPRDRINAARTLLTTRHGYGANDDGDGVNRGGVRVVLNIPDSLSDSEYAASLQIASRRVTDGRG